MKNLEQTHVLIALGQKTQIAPRHRPHGLSTKNPNPKNPIQYCKPLNRDPKTTINDDAM